LFFTEGTSNYESNNREYIKWKITDIAAEDDLLLLSQIGILKSEQ